MQARETAAANLTVSMPQDTQNQQHLERSEHLLHIMTIINSSLNLDEVLRHVMDQLIELTRAERGVIAFVDRETGALSFPVARNMDRETLEDPTFDVSRTLIRKVSDSGQGELLLSAMDDPKYARNESIVAKGLRSVLCVPLVTRKNDVLGAVWVDNKMAGVFTKADLEMLTEFGRHAANAIDHAGKYGTLLELKTYQESIFESLGSGILAVDIEGRVTAFNRSAERIFALPRARVMGLPVDEALHGRAAEMFGRLLREVMQSGRPLLGRRHSGYFVGAGPVELILAATPLKTVEGTQIGATLILDDVSQQLALEAERDAEAAEKHRLRQTLGKLVSADVANLAEREIDPLAGGRLRTVSALFVDIVGFSTRCETLPPDRIISMLNKYFKAMCDVVMRNNGTVKQFVGDEIMVLFNAAKETPDHPLLALWTALEMVEQLQALALEDPRGEHGFYDVKIGVHTGPVVYGAVGTENRMEFAAVGDTVNLTSRVMGLNPALGTRILVSEDLYREVYCRASGSIEFIARGAHQVRGRNLPVNVYEVRSTAWH